MAAHASKRKALVVVDLADMKATDRDDCLLTTYILGSCGGVAVYDPEAGVGGLLHFMLPNSEIDRNHARRNPYLFADTGLPLLFRKCYKLGAAKERMIVKLGGAADVMDPKERFGMGRSNREIAHEVLNRNNVLVQAEYVGGRSGVALSLDVATGQVVARLPSGEEISI